MLRDVPATVRDVAARVEQIEAEAWAQLQLSIPAAVASALGSRVRRDDGAVWQALPGVDVAAVSRVLGAGFGSPLTAARFAEIREWFAECRVRRWMIEWSPGAAPDDATRMLAQHGRATRRPAVKLHRALDLQPDVQQRAHSFTIREIDASDAAAFEAIIAEPLGLALIPGLARSTLGHAGWHHYLAFDDEEPVAGGAVFVHDGGAWLGLGATAPDARRRGAQTALLRRRIRDAHRLGARWATMETAPHTDESRNPSLENALRAGFEILYDRPRFVFGEGAASTQL